MADAHIITATEASRAFSEFLHRVCYGGESFVIKKGQRLMARIVPVVEAQPEAEEPIPVPMMAVKEAEPPEAPLPDLAADDAEFYQAWMEQVRKVEA